MNSDVRVGVRKTAKFLTLVATLALTNICLQPVQAAPMAESEEAALNTTFMDLIISGKSSYNPLKELGDNKSELKSRDKVVLSKHADGTTVQDISGSWGHMLVEENQNSKSPAVHLVKRETTILKDSPLPGLVKTVIEDYSNDTEKVISYFANGHQETITYKAGARIKVSIN